MFFLFFFFSSRRRHTRSLCDWSSDVCSSDLPESPGTSASRAADSFRPPPPPARAAERRGATTRGSGTVHGPASQRNSNRAGEAGSPYREYYLKTNGFGVASLPYALKISSTGLRNILAILNAKGRLGSYFSVSMALMVWRETPSFPARSAWVKLSRVRKSRTPFFTGTSGRQCPSRVPRA